MIWLGIVWNVALTVWFVLDPHPKLDLQHCAFDRVAFTKTCFPKNRCWLDSNGDAECWRVAKLEKR